MIVFAWEIREKCTEQNRVMNQWYRDLHKIFNNPMPRLFKSNFCCPYHFTHQNIIVHNNIKAKLYFNGNLIQPNFVVGVLNVSLNKETFLR